MHRPLPLVAALCLVTTVGSITARPALAAAEELCLPDASPTPDWWSPGLSTIKREVRWNGALVRKLDAGHVHARMRAVWSPAADQAFFEFRVAGDPSLDPAHDAVLFAISDPTGSDPELFVRFDPLLDCADPTDCDRGGIPLSDAAIHYAEATTQGTSWTWSAPSETNPSAELVVEHPWIAVDTTAAGTTWTLSFALSLPTDGGGEPIARRIFADAVAYVPGPTSGTIHELPLTCTSTSMTSNDCLVFVTGLDEVPQDLPIATIPDAWARVDAGICDGV